MDKNKNSIHWMITSSNFNKLILRATGTTDADSYNSENAKRVYVSIMKNEIILKGYIQFTLGGEHYGTQKMQTRPSLKKLMRIFTRLPILRISSNM